MADSNLYVRPVHGLSDLESGWLVSASIGDEGETMPMLYETGLSSGHRFAVRHAIAGVDAITTWSVDNPEMGFNEGNVALYLPSNLGETASPGHPIYTRFDRLLAVAHHSQQVNGLDQFRALDVGSVVPLRAEGAHGYFVVALQPDSSGDDYLLARRINRQHFQVVRVNKEATDKLDFEDGVVVSTFPFEEMKNNVPAINLEDLFGETVFEKNG